MSSRRICGFSLSQNPAKSVVVCTARWLGANRLHYDCSPKRPNCRGISHAKEILNTGGNPRRLSAFVMNFRMPSTL